MRFSFSILLIINALISFAQTSEEQQVIVIHGHQNGPSSTMIDFMLEKINPYPEEIDHSYTVKFIENITYNTNKEGQAQVVISLEQFRVEGLKKHLDFSFEDLFMPSAIDFQIGIFAEEKPTITKTFSRKGIRNGKTDTFTLPLEEGQTIKILAADLIYRQEHQLVMIQRIRLIDEYIGAFYSLEQIADDISALSPLLENPRTIPTAKEQINEIEEQYRAVSLLDFWDKLDYKRSEATTGYDIDGMQVEVRNYLAQEARRVQFNVNNRQLAYQQQGLELYHEGKIEKARKNFEAAIEHTPNFPPPHYMLALIAYQKEDYETAIHHTQYLLDPTKVNDEPTVEKAKELAQLIFDDLLKKGVDLYQSKGKEKALPYFQQAEHFCINTIGVLCDLEELEEWIGK